VTTPRRREQLARAQAAKRQREEGEGIVRVLVRIPKRRRAQLEDLIGEWMLEDLAHPDVAEG
jgi:hypothetical protein